MPRSRVDLALLLAGTDRRSIGSANRVAQLVLRAPERAAELVEAMESSDSVLRMRAADALEKVGRISPGTIQPYTAKLLRLARLTRQAEMQWHLAQLLRRLGLRPSQRTAARHLMQGYLGSTSTIVRTEALTTLVHLAGKHRSFQSAVRRELQRRLRHGAPAERARARRLLAALER